MLGRVEKHVLFLEALFTQSVRDGARGQATNLSRVLRSAYEPLAKVRGELNPEVQAGGEVRTIQNLLVELGAGEWRRPC